MAEDCVDTQLSSSIKVLVLLLLSTGFQIDPVWNDQFSPTPLFAPPPHCFAVWVSPLSVHSHSSPASLTHPENTFSVTVLQHQSPLPLPKPTASPWPCHLACRFFFPTPFFFCLVPSVSLQTHIITKPSSVPHHPCPAAALLPPT